MAHRLALEAEAELEDIWQYTATESSSVETADRLIDSLTTRFYLALLNFKWVAGHEG